MSPAPGWRFPSTSPNRRSLPAAVIHARSAIFAAARNQRRGSPGASGPFPSEPDPSRSRSATASIAATDIPCPYTGSKLQIASPVTRNPSRYLGSLS